MGKALSKSVLALAIASVPFASLSGQTPSVELPTPPSGWETRTSGTTTIVEKRGVKITIGPWQPTGGSSTRDWLQAQETKATGNAQYIKTHSIQAETAIPGSYSLLRQITENGSELMSVLYACPGSGGQLKMMEMRAQISRQTASIVQEGAKYGETVCKAERGALMGQNAADDDGIVRVSSANPSLSAANARIPAGSRPQSVRIVLKQSFSGFPAVPVSKAKAQLNFANGYATTCTKWNPLRHSPTPSSAGKLKKCAFERATSKGKLAQKFAPGQTIDVAFGRITGSTAGAGGNASTLSSGTLRMTRSGRIEIGKFTGFSAQASGAYAAGGSRKMALVGQYYLNGHTITIRTDRGDVYHGFIAASSRNGSGKIDDVFINGEHYWDRSK